MACSERINQCAEEFELIWKKILPLAVDYMIGKDQKEVVTHVQAMLLEYLKDNEYSSVSSIADYMGVTMAAVSSLTDRLVKTGMINRERSEADRRVVYISLAPQGKEALDEYYLSKKKKFMLLLETMGEENAWHYLKAQKIFYNALEKIYAKNKRGINDGTHN